MNITPPPPLAYFYQINTRTATIWFWSFVGIFAVLWILLPALLHTGYRNDVIEIQSVAKEWLLATTKHPMSPAWLLEILNIITNRSFAAPFIASQLCTVLTLWSVWQLGRTVLSEKLALIGAFSMLPYRFFTNESVLYNQNNLLIAFWSLSILLVFRAFQTNKLRYWLGSGAAIGLAFHSKYAAVFLVAAILLYMLVRSEGRKHWRTIGPYLTTLTAFVIFFPHLVWLFQNDFATLNYIQKLHHYSGWQGHLISPINFSTHQLTYLIFLPIILFPVLGLFGRWKLRYGKTSNERECEKFLFYCFMVPLVLQMIYGFVESVHVKMAYGAPLWTFFGVWLLLRFQPQETAQSFRQTIRLVVCVEVIIAAGFLFTFFTGKQIDRCYFPTRELAAESEHIWNTRFTVPCPYLTGETQIARSAGYGMRTRPSIHLLSAPLMRIQDSDVNEHGGMIFWDYAESPELPNNIKERFPRAEPLPEPLILRYQVWAKRPPLQVGVAVIPPPEHK